MREGFEKQTRRSKLSFWDRMGQNPIKGLLQMLENMVARDGVDPVVRQIQSREFRG
jgi:hypothetical protein